MRRRVPKEPVTERLPAAPDVVRAQEPGWGQGLAQRLPVQQETPEREERA